MRHKPEDLERVARAMCVAVGREPDAVVTRTPPSILGGPTHQVYIINPKAPAGPLWREYIDFAQVALDEVAAALEAVAFKARRD